MGERASLTACRLRLAVPLVVLAGALPSAACSPASSLATTRVACDAASICPNDPPPTELVIDQCQTGTMGGCAGPYQSYFDCTSDDRVCAYDGTTDVLATQEACASQAAALAACGDGGS
jgi:hypothetical protein